MKVKVKSEFVDDSFPQDEGLNHKRIVDVVVLLFMIMLQSRVKLATVQETLAIHGGDVLYITADGDTVNTETKSLWNQFAPVRRA